MPVDLRPRVAKFDPKSEDNQNKKSGSLHHCFGSPHFVTLLYVCGFSSHTAVFIGRQKIA